jgi:hypothetical protein
VARGGGQSCVNINRYLYQQNTCETVMMRVRKEYNMAIISVNFFGELLRYLLF